MIHSKARNNYKSIGVATWIFVKSRHRHGIFFGFNLRRHANLIPQERGIQDPIIQIDVTGEMVALHMENDSPRERLIVTNFKKSP